MRLSHSQLDTFLKCKRWWYLSYVEKIQVPSDTRHMRRGSCFHKVAEFILLNNPTIEQMKQKFEEQWIEQKLTDFEERKTETLLALVEFFNTRPLDITTTEMKLYRTDPEFVSYLDAVKHKDNVAVVIDYKTSSQVSDDYRSQMMRYAWNFWKQFNIIPVTEVWFVMFQPIRKVVYSFTWEELNECEQEIRDSSNFMDDNLSNKKAFVCCKDEGKQCHFFCPYGNICANEKSDNMNFVLHLLGNYIYLEGELHPTLNKQLHKKFSYELQNAHWIKKNNPMASTVIDFWKENKRLLPIGFLNGLKKTLNDWAIFNKKELILTVKEKRVFNGETITMPDKIKYELRDYQKEAVNKFIENKIGMVEIGTGGGKTVIYSEIIRKLNMKTLIIVNRRELLRQVKKEIEEQLNVEVGIIGDGECILKQITVATIQSLSKDLKKFKEYLRSIRFSIMDEAQYVGSRTYWKLAHQLVNTEFRLAGSGTCRRSDGNDLYLQAVNGEIIFNKPAIELVAEGILMEPELFFFKDYITKDAIKEQLSKIKKEGLINETDKYNEVYRVLITQNAIRNDLVIKLVKDNKNKKVLVLTKAIEHGQALSTALGCDFIYGDTNKEDRENILEKFKQGDGGVLVGSLEIFSTGLNIVRLNLICNVSGMKSDIKSIQSLGRLLRKYSGKESCSYYDFIDEGKFFRTASYKRMKSFEKEGHTVNTIYYNT
jgi:superfamily II DNA or RNA helicase